MELTTAQKNIIKQLNAIEGASGLRVIQEVEYTFLSLLAEQHNLSNRIIQLETNNKKGRLWDQELHSSRDLYENTLSYLHRESKRISATFNIQGGVTNPPREVVVLIEFISRLSRNLDVLLNPEARKDEE